MSCDGYATQIAHRKVAAKPFKTAAENSDLEEAELWIRRIGKRIKQECLAIHYDSFHYTVNINEEIASESVSETLERLLAAISGRLESPSLTTLLVGNMVTATVTRHSNPLQVALAVQMRDSKSRVELMSTYNITCTYTELRRFLKSAATAAANDEGIHGLPGNSMKQFVEDNFDQNISSQNGKVQTHQIAGIEITPMPTDMIYSQKTCHHLR